MVLPYRQCHAHHGSNENANNSIDHGSNENANNSIVNRFSVSGTGFVILALEPSLRPPQKEFVCD
jgi:hypothetical protein